MAQRSPDGSRDVFADLEAESGTLVVAFGGLAGGLGIPPFEFMAAIDSEFSVKRAFVRDRHALWYQRGVEGLGSNVGETAAGLRKLVHTADVGRVVFIGCSSGGYAALLFAALVGAHAVLAFSPQTLVAPDRRAAAGDDRWPDRTAALSEAGFERDYADLRQVLRRSPGADRPPRMVLRYPQSDRLDAVHAENLAGLPSVELVPMPGGEHNIPKVLKREGRLGAVLGDCISPDSP